MKELRNFCRKARLAQDYIIFASRRSIEPEDLFRGDPGRSPEGDMEGAYNGQMICIKR